MFSFLLKIKIFIFYIYICVYDKWLSIKQNHCVDHDKDKRCLSRRVVRKFPNTTNNVHAINTACYLIKKKNRSHSSNYTINSNGHGVWALGKPRASYDTLQKSLGSHDNVIIVATVQYVLFEQK